MTDSSKRQVQRIKREIRQVQNAVNRSLESMMVHKQLLKGSLFQWSRRCGKPSCHCSMGEKHETWVFSNPSSENITLRRLYLSEEDLKRFLAPGISYKRFRQERASIIKDQERLRTLLKELEDKLLIVPPHSQKEEPR